MDVECGDDEDRVPPEHLVFLCTLVTALDEWVRFSYAYLGTSHLLNRRERRDIDRTHMLAKTAIAICDAEVVLRACAGVIFNWDIVNEGIICRTT